MIVIHQGKYWQSAGPCLTSSAADRSAPLAGEKTHTESPQRRWRWPNHTAPTAASGTNQSLGAEVNIHKVNTEMLYDKCSDDFVHNQE